MAIKLDNLFEWRHFPAGTTMTLRGTDVRRIRLNVNSPDRCPLYVVNEEGEIIRFLATAVGCDVIEFWEGGNITLTHSVNDVYVYTADKDPDFNEVEEPEIFTRIAERAPRNPEFEMMMHMANQNAERRMLQILAEREAQNERRNQYNTAYANTSGANATPAGSGATGQAADGQPPAGGNGENQPATESGSSGNQLPDGNSGNN